jgi:osmotically-inducible protein OsmY
MLKSLGVVLGISMLVLTGSATAEEGRLDNRLEDRVEKQLNQDRQLKGINIDVDEGVVTLRGDVANSTEKARAERVARSAGARRVVNKLEIDVDKAARRIDESAEARKERIDTRADRQKDAVERQAEAAKERLDDGGTIQTDRRRDVRPVARDTRVDERRRTNDVADPLVTAKVKTSILGDDLLDKSDINVDTDRDGVVTLRGTVASEAARARAIEIARRTEGVRKVVDALAVRAPVERR